MAVADGRLKRRRGPCLERIRRLDVVVAVDRQVRPALPALGVGDDSGEAVLDDVDDLRLEARALEPVAQPSGVAHAVLATLGQRADGWDAQLFDQVIEVLLASGLRDGKR